MFESLFILLASICAAGIALVAACYKDWAGVGSALLLLILAVLAISIGLQGIGLQVMLPLFLLLFASTFYRHRSINILASICMLSSVTLAFFGVQFISGLDGTAAFYLALFFASAISALGILGIFEDDILKYLAISNAVQLAFVALDLSVVAISGKMGVLATIQIFNYAFAGTLLFTALCVLTDNLKGRRFDEIYAYHRTPANAVAASIAGLSLAGIPALNIFVAEWYLFITAYSINPAITILSIFAALILFIMYFKVVFALFVNRQPAGMQPVGTRPKQTKPVMMFPAVPTAVNLALALVCVVLGLFPFLQVMLLGG